MLLRHRTPDIDTTPAILAPGLQHLDQRWVAMLRWLNAARLDYVLVGPVAWAIRGQLGDDETSPAAPVAIVPAPYLRNYERLSTVLVGHDAALRSDAARSADAAVAEVKLSADKLARGRRWRLRVGGLDLDVESSGGRTASARAQPGVHGPHETGTPIGDGTRYQELLYESARIELSPGLAVEVAGPEDLERYAHPRRTGVAPEFRITRARDREAAPPSPAPHHG